MQVLIKDLLAFSRVGRNDGASANVDGNSVMEEVLEALASAIEESGAVVTYGKLPTVWRDRTQMAQVLQNLIGNAIKFRGTEPPVVSVQSEKAGQHWEFSVSDNGIGIAPEYAESVFVVFQSLHARTEYPGNGIGLAICKKTIERYGGGIWMSGWNRTPVPAPPSSSPCPYMVPMNMVPMNRLPINMIPTNMVAMKKKGRGHEASARTAHRG